MNTHHRAILAPLLAVVALLCGLAGTASGAFNPAAQNPHYGGNLLRVSEASAFESLQPADPVKGSGEWIYDSASGVPAYVRQNPWSAFDPEGLDMKGAADAAQNMLSHVESAIRNVQPAQLIDAAIEGATAVGELADAGIDKFTSDNKGGEKVGNFAAGFHPIVAAGESAEYLSENGVTTGTVAATGVGLLLRKVPGMKGKGDDLLESARGVQKKAGKMTREERWRELATEGKLSKQEIEHIRRHDGKGMQEKFGKELAHKPKKSNAHGHGYEEAVPKTEADHRGIQHRYLKERKTGTTISRPKQPKRPGAKLNVPPPGSLP